jgi:phospholipid/cholesterol/gamma-HCH transport system ATP-binding protein
MELSTLEQGRDEVARDPVHIQVSDLHFRRGSRSVFDGVDAVVLRDKINVILGGSGAGKTTLLRMFGCLLRPDSGSILVDGETELTTLNRAGMREYRRRVGMMFQGGALLDSMTVFDNAALPLREHLKLGEAEIRREVEDVFASVGLEEVDGLLPAELSGGMRKRAALARALITAPEILLCDEPFSGLDPATVRLVESLLEDVNERLGVTMVIASHHIASTFRMADRIVLLVDGKAVVGTPDEFRSSTDPEVESFFAGELR